MRKMAEFSSSSCELCAFILSNNLDGLLDFLRASKSVVDVDNLSIYRIIKRYSQFLSEVTEKDALLYSSTWKSATVLQSGSRKKTLEILDILLKHQLTPNTVTKVETPLMAAVSTHDEDIVKLLLEHGANPDLQDGQGDMNAFALAIILNDPAVVKLMLSYGANINRACCQDMTPLQLSMNKSVEVSKMLLQHGANVQQVLQIQGNQAVSLAMPPLVHAVETSNIYLASILLDHGEDINQIYGDRSNSPIHLAVQKGNEKMVKVLIQYGANLDKTNGRGNTPLGLALNLHENGPGICQALISSGCSLRKGSVFNVFQKHFPPIHIAAFLGHYFHLDMIKLMLKCMLQYCPHGDDLLEGEEVFVKRRQKICSSERSLDLQKKEEQKFINMQALDNSTALFMAVLGGNLEIATYLLEKGADPYIKCCHGNLLHASVMAGIGSEDVLKFALQFDFDIDMLNDDGNTPLILAARNTNSSNCLTLIEQGARLDVEDGKFGETALSASVYFGCEENAATLLKHGANPDIPDSRDTTAVYWAIFNCRETTLMYLLEAGAQLSRQDFGRYPRNIKVMKNRELKTMIQDYVSQPLSLQHLCLINVRRHLSRGNHGRSIIKSIGSLPVPVKLCRYLSLDL